MHFYFTMRRLFKSVELNRSEGPFFLSTKHQQKCQSLPSLDLIERLSMRSCLPSEKDLMKKVISNAHRRNPHQRTFKKCSWSNSELGTLCFEKPKLTSTKMIINETRNFHVQLDIWRKDLTSSAFSIFSKNAREMFDFSIHSSLF